MSQNEVLLISKLLLKLGLVLSNSEAKRLIIQGGVRLDGGKITDPLFVLPKNSEMLLHCKHSYTKIRRSV